MKGKIVIHSWLLLAHRRLKILWVQVVWAVQWSHDGATGNTGKVEKED